MCVIDSFALLFSPPFLHLSPYPSLLQLIPLAAGLGGGVLLILIVTVSFLILCVCLYKRRKAR